MCCRMKKRRQDIESLINSILTDLRKNRAFYHPAVGDITKWFDCCYEVVWNAIHSVLKQPEDLQLWEETTPAKGRNRQIIDFLHHECGLLSKDTIQQATSNSEIANRFQVCYPDLKDEAKLLHHIEILTGTVSQLAYHHLSKSEKCVRDTALPSSGTKQCGPGISIRTKRIIAFAEQSLNDYLHERTDQLPIYDEIGKIVKPNVSKAWVQYVLSKHLPPEAFEFWKNNGQRANHHKIARLLNYAGQHAVRHLKYSHYRLPPISKMSERFDLSDETVVRVIQEQLPEEQAVLWRPVHRQRQNSLRVHYRIRYLTKVAHKHQNNPSWRLPTQSEIGRRFNVDQRSVSRIIRQWLPKDLVALWTVYKNHPRG